MRDDKHTANDLCPRRRRLSMLIGSALTSIAIHGTVYAEPQARFLPDTVVSASRSRSSNEKKNHAGMIKKFEEIAPKAKKAGVPNIVCFFGNRRGMSDEVGIANSIECLKKCKPIAEEAGVTLVVENLNLINHKDYIGALTPYCFKILKAVNSPRIKLLYDIYHAQMMEGNIIATIKKNHGLIGHYHTGGVPGRAEIDETQEIFYPPIVKAIIDTGYTGFMAHEFIPRKPDPVKSLRDALVLCDV